ncbi:unnamed protein product [Clavelina lepadiformis]|uniref:Uncharacterized protein n=1 Tax=Clavelina lepadiformis TaxID=159417 RepID=A0ABP0FGH0_CLALP
MQYLSCRCSIKVHLKFQSICKSACVSLFISIMSCAALLHNLYTVGCRCGLNLAEMQRCYIAQQIMCGIDDMMDLVGLQLIKTLAGKCILVFSSVSTSLHLFIHGTMFWHGIANSMKLSLHVIVVIHVIVISIIFTLLFRFLKKSMNSPQLIFMKQFILL